MSLTRLQIRQKLGKEETGMAVLGIATSDGTTTTVVDATRLKGPFSASAFTRGAAVRFSTLNSVAATTNTFVDSYDPATGTITLSPAITATKSADVFEVWPALIGPQDSVARVDEAIDRALTKRCLRWSPLPLTKVTDGDMGDTAVTNLWTGTNATPTKVAISFPDKIGRRYLRTLLPAASGYAYSVTIPAVGGDVWRVSVLVRAVTGTAVFTPYDVTNSADISFDSGGDGGSYAGTAWKHLDNTFTVPSTCEQIRFHLGGTANNDDIYWTNLIAYEQNETQFVLPARVKSVNRVGNTMYRHGDDVEEFYWTQYCQDGRHAWIQDEMPGVVVRLSSPPGTSYPVYVEELCGHDALSSDTSTTEAPEDLVLPATAFEVLKPMANKNYAVPTPQGYLAPSDVRQKRDEALRRMVSAQKYWGAQSKVVLR